jgi:hypothetical protein
VLAVTHCPSGKHREWDQYCKYCPGSLASLAYQHNCVEEKDTRGPSCAHGAADFCMQCLVDDDQLYERVVGRKHALQAVHSLMVWMACRGHMDFDEALDSFYEMARADMGLR